MRTAVFRGGGFSAGQIGRGRLCCPGMKVQGRGARAASGEAGGPVDQLADRERWEGAALSLAATATNDAEPAVVREIREASEGLIRQGRSLEALEYVMNALSDLAGRCEDLELELADLEWEGQSTRAPRSPHVKRKGK